MKPQRRPNYWNDRRFEKKHGCKRQNIKRVCAELGCNTTLNSYNENDCCSLHNFAYVVRNRIGLDGSMLVDR